MTVKKVLVNLISLIILGAQLAIEGIIIKNVVDLAILPDQYLTIFYILMGVAALISFLLLFVLRNGPILQTIRSLVAIVITVAMVLGNMALSDLVGTLNENLRQVAAATHPGSVIGVYVLNEDAAQSIQDAKDYTFGYGTNFDGTRTRDSLSLIKEDVEQSLEISSYDTVFDAIDALYAGDIQALVMNEVYMEVLSGSATEEEPDQYASFAGNVRMLTSYELRDDDDSDLVKVEVEDTSVKDVTEDPFIVYLSGSDTRSTMLTTSRSDVNILMCVNPKNRQILLVNTPRDYYIPISISEFESKDKLTHAGIYGIDCSIDTLENLYDVTINYYAQINFTGFEKLIDAVGGVTVYSDYEFEAGGYYFEEGYNDLDGEKALVFSRERHSLSSGDNARGQNQMRVIMALVDKLTSGTTILENYSEILDSLSGMFMSDMATTDITGLIRMQLEEGGSWDVKTYAVTGYGDYDYTFSMPKTSLYVTVPYEDTVEKGTELMEKLLAGNLLTTEDIEGSSEEDDD